jgi:RNA polymerase sigma-70 factor (ECF subfamily)
MQDLQPTQESCQADILNRFMDGLSDTDASLLMMYLDGLSSDESAKVLGISSNAVRSRIKRIKNEFETNYIGD